MVVCHVLYALLWLKSVVRVKTTGKLTVVCHVLCVVMVKECGKSEDSRETGVGLICTVCRPGGTGCVL